MSRFDEIKEKLKLFIERKHAKQCGLALGGGVAWGISHIGVIEALTELEIKINAIAGTSAGSLVASLYAFGVPIETIKREAMKLGMSDIIKLRLPRMGLSSSEGIGEIIKKIIGDVKIEDARIPLYIPSVNLTNGQAEAFDKGSVADAVRASSSIPGIYVPLEINKHLYVDGSLLADVPCEILKRKGIDFVIGVELMDEEEFRKSPTNIFEVIMKSIRIMINETRMERLRFADIIIRPNVHGIGQFEFDKAEHLIKRGKEAVSEHIEFIAQSLNYDKEAQ